MPRKTAFFEGWSWLKFNNLGLPLGTYMKVYTNVVKGLKLKVRKFWELILTFVEVTGKKTSTGGGLGVGVGKGRAFWPLRHPAILDRVNYKCYIKKEFYNTWIKSRTFIHETRRDELQCCEYTAVPKLSQGTAVFGGKFC